MILTTLSSLILIWEVLKLKVFSKNAQLEKFRIKLASKLKNRKVKKYGLW